MRYKNKDLCRIRTITTFLSLTDDKTNWKQQILKASHFCAALSEKFFANGYTVQSVRIVTNPFGEYLNTASLGRAREDLAYLSNLLNASDLSGIRIRFAIGEARTQEEIALLPELVKEFGDLCNVCVNVGRDDSGILDDTLITHAAEAVRKISQITPRGEGNFNFTINFNCEPLIPYFPAGYHRKALGDCFVVGLETPDLLVAVLEDYNKHSKGLTHNDRFNGYFEVMRAALQYHVTTIYNVIAQSTSTNAFSFSGIDSSAAPSKHCASMVEVYAQMGVAYFGASGTVEA